MAVDDEWDLLDIMDSDGTGLEHEAREDNWDAVECDVESSGDVVVVVTAERRAKKPSVMCLLFALHQVQRGAKQSKAHLPFKKKSSR